MHRYRDRNCPSICFSNKRKSDIRKNLYVPRRKRLLGHADVSTTMNINAHATREAKRTSARLLDKVVGGE